MVKLVPLSSFCGRCRNLEFAITLGLDTRHSWVTRREYPDKLHARHVRLPPVKGQEEGGAETGVLSDKQTSLCLFS